MNGSEHEQALHYAMVIEWSDDDQAYIVSLPEWEPAGVMGHTHGDTYEDAVRMGRELLELLVESRQVEGTPLPEPKLFAAAK